VRRKENPLAHRCFVSRRPRNERKYNERKKDDPTPDAPAQRASTEKYVEE